MFDLNNCNYLKRNDKTWIYEILTCKRCDCPFKYISTVKYWCVCIYSLITLIHKIYHSDLNSFNMAKNVTIHSNISPQFVIFHIYGLHNTLTRRKNTQVFNLIVCSTLFLSLDYNVLYLWSRLDSYTIEYINSHDHLNSNSYLRQRTK